MKFSFVLYGPFFLLLILWALLSDRNLNDVATLDNILTSRGGISRDPILGLICFIIFLALVARATARHVGSGGRILATSGDALWLYAKRSIDLSEIDSVDLETGVFGSQRLILKSASGARLAIPLVWAIYSDDLPEVIKRLALRGRSQVS